MKLARMCGTVVGRLLVLLGQCSPSPFGGRPVEFGVDQLAMMGKQKLGERFFIPGFLGCVWQCLDVSWMVP